MSRGTEGQRDKGTEGVGVAPDHEGKSGLPDRRLLATVRGFMAPDEGARLYDLALEAGRRGPCLEIGGFCGKSTMYLGSGCRDAGGILYSIDHHRGSEEHQPGEEYFDPALWDPRLGRINSFTEFIRTVEQGGLTDTVVPIVSASATAARSWATPLSLVLIDGGHSYAAAFSDYNGWAGHLMPGGFLAIHDIFADPGAGGQAPRQIYKLAAGSGLFRRLQTTGTLGVLQRRAPGETPDGP